MNWNRARPFTPDSGRHLIEASERGLAEVLALEFEPAPQELSDALTYCDMTTSPDGELVPVEQRLAEIHDRYGPGHVSIHGVSARL